MRGFLRNDPRSLRSNDPIDRRTGNPVHSHGSLLSLIRHSLHFLVASSRRASKLEPSSSIQSIGTKPIPSLSPSAWSRLLLRTLTPSNPNQSSPRMATRIDPVDTDCFATPHQLPHRSLTSTRSIHRLGPIVHRSSLLRSLCFFFLASTQSIDRRPSWTICHPAPWSLFRG